MTDTIRSAQIAHVLFLDIVGYSRQSTSAQARMIQALNAAAQASSAFAEAKAAGDVQAIPTGDGMALLFYSDVIAPARCAVDIATQARAASSANALPLRMGIHSGLVQMQMDIAGRENVVGEGINTAQRVMDLGDEGHILLSAQYAAWLRQFDEWAPRLRPLGEGAVKHGQRVQLFSLCGEGFGREEAPARVSFRAGSDIPRKHVALLYKPNLQPDEEILQRVEARLREHGHEVFVDNQQRISAAWANAIEEPIRRSDAVIAIVSPRALQSEMLEFEIETAHDQQIRTGSPVILPVRIGAEEPVEGMIGAIIRPLAQFVWREPGDDQRLVTELLSAIEEPPKPRVEEVKLEPVGGAVPPDSPFYVRRPSDDEFIKALEERESILLVKGARQMGKTSMLAQGSKRARELGWRCALTDFQKLSASQIASEDLFYKLLAGTLARQLKFAYDFGSEWVDLFGPNLNMENFLRELLDSTDEQLVWVMDEVDKLFLAPFASDFFGLVRSWHNSRSTEPGGPWGKLTVVIAYATEAHLFIQDLNQSPFNVGRRIDLQDFNVQQLVDLNGRYGLPLRSYEEVEGLHALIGGQPFLSRRALDSLATGRLSYAALLDEAPRDEGPFSDHLKRLLVAVSRLPSVTQYVRGILSGAPANDQDSFYRLYAAGVVTQTRSGAVEFRCDLYRRYLAAHLQ